MSTRASGGGDGDIAVARQLQSELARQVAVRDGFPSPLRTVAGFHVGFGDDGAVARAAAVLLDADTLQVIGARAVRIAASTPYVPGLLSFRQLPALLQALDALPQRPDLALIDGNGVAHPRGLGIAAHFGVVTGLPSIGVARKILTGNGPDPHQVRGAYTALRHRGRQIGWLLRSKPDCDPLVISPGHRVAMASAADLVVRFTAGDRLPEPTRLAQALAFRHTRNIGDPLP